MTHAFIKKADDVIATSSCDLGFIFSKVKLLRELEKQVAACSEQRIASYCKVANMLDGTLTLIAANGSIATHIRHHTSELLAKFKQQPGLQHIQLIECKVRPASDPLLVDREENRAAPLKPLTPETSAMVNDIADAIQDEPLKAVMKRIASHVVDCN